MANMLMMRYAASRGNDQNGDHMNTGNEMAHNAMNNNEMAYRGPAYQHPSDNYRDGAESRYRGRDGRWKSGTRRSEYDAGMNGNYSADSEGAGMNYGSRDQRRSSGDDEDEEGRK